MENREFVDIKILEEFDIYIIKLVHSEVIYITLHKRRDNPERLKNTV